MTAEERASWENDTADITKNEPGYTICNKTSVSGNQSIVEYLFDQGKCGDICRNGNVFRVCYLY